MTRQKIFITGASSGLGAGMARAFAAKGRDLALCARRIDRLIRELGEELGVTAIVVSHDLPSIFGVADRVAFLYGGVVHALAAPAALRASPDPIVQQFVTGRSSGPMETPGF